MLVRDFESAAKAIHSAVANRWGTGGRYPRCEAQNERLKRIPNQCGPISGAI